MNNNREILKAICKGLKPALDLARETGAEITMNDLLTDYYKKDSNVTDLKTFDEWKKIGYNVKKGEKAFLFWGHKRKVNQEQEQAEDKKAEFFPLSYLFDVSQVEKRVK